jgi:hypothetical protein
MPSKAIVSTDLLSSSKKATTQPIVLATTTIGHITNDANSNTRFIKVIARVLVCMNVHDLYISDRCCCSIGLSVRHFFRCKCKFLNYQKSGVNFIDHVFVILSWKFYSFCNLIGQICDQLQVCLLLLSSSYVPSSN